MRVTESPASTRLVVGIDATAAAVMRFPGGSRPVALVDAALDVTAVRLPREAHIVPLDSRELDLEALHHLSIAATRATSLIAIGGGSTIDAAKITRLFLAVPAIVETVRRFTVRSGCYRLPELTAHRRPHVPLLVLPTTFGTATEVSPVACVRTPNGRRLLSGSLLRADDAALDPLLTRTLPREQQMEGLLEILLRVIGPTIGSPVHAAADHDTRSIVHGVVGLAEKLRRDALSMQDLLFAAQLSAATQRGWALTGRETYAAKHWYLANELSWVTGTRKMPATAAVLPTLWNRIEGGATEWGSRDRLATAWGWVRESVVELPATAGDGIRALLQRWGVASIPQPSAATLREVSERIVASWGAPFPALDGIDSEAVHGILTESFAPTRTPSSSPERR